MIRAEDLQRAVDDAHISRNELARRVGLDRRTVGKWFEPGGEVPVKYAQQVRSALSEDSGLGSYSDMAILAEIARRLDEARTLRSDYEAEMVRRPEDTGNQTEDRGNVTTVPDGEQVSSSPPETSPEDDRNELRNGPRAGWGPLE